MIEWLRSHNASLAPAERIAFVGIDVQKIEPGLTELLTAFEVATTTAQTSNAGGGTDPHTLTSAAATVRRLMAGQLAPGAAEAASALQTLTEAAPRLATPALRALCRNTARYVDTYLNPEREDGLGVRDEYLATAVLETLAERPGLTVVWAHNEHVAVNPDFFGARAMGHHLREALGDGYLALGMLFGDGAFLARSWEERSANKVAEFRVGPAGEDHVERCFAGRPLGLFNAEHVPGCTKSTRRRFLGSLYDPEVDAHHPETFRIERPLTDFNLVAWLPKTSAARYLGMSTGASATGLG